MIFRIEVCTVGTGTMLQHVIGDGVGGGDLRFSVDELLTSKCVCTVSCINVQML